MPKLCPNPTLISIVRSIYLTWPASRFVDLRIQILYLSLNFRSISVCLSPRDLSSRGSDAVSILPSECLFVRVRARLCALRPRPRRSPPPQKKKNFGPSGGAVVSLNHRRLNPPLPPHRPKSKLREVPPPHEKYCSHCRRMIFMSDSPSLQNFSFLLPFYFAVLQRKQTYFCWMLLLNALNHLYEQLCSKLRLLFL